jgi:2-hydroxychromene-2-carboxylate isomerase
MPEIDANHAALEASGHWGVPTMVFQDEPFFGQDRIDTLRWRLEKAGLVRD